jgi:uncharacterized membrane protein YciS (DUF1049 family)
MRWVRRWIGVALLVAFLVGGWRLAHENGERVTVSYLFGAIEMPLWQALLWAFGAGFALAGVGWLWLGLRSRMVERRYRKTVGALEAEVHQLRNLPLATEREPTSARGGGRDPARAVRWGG